MTQQHGNPQSDKPNEESSPSPASDPQNQPQSTPHREPLGTAAGDGAPINPALETTVWNGRTHWHHYLGRVFLGGIGIIMGWYAISKLATRQDWSASTAMLSGAILAILVFVVIGGSILYRVLQERYRLTGQRLFIERGILSQTIDQTELIRVDDVRVHKRLIDRFLNMGTVEIRSTDATDQGINIRGIKGAEEVAEQVRNSMRALRSKSLFIENL